MLEIIWQLVALLGIIAGALAFFHEPVIGKLLRWIKSTIKLYEIKTNTHLNYFNTILSTNRSPAWDPDLCEDIRIKNSKINYSIVKGVDAPAFTDNIENSNNYGLPSRIEKVTNFIERLISWREGLHGSKKNVFVVLGDPGSGKSSLAVQAMHYIATKGKEKKYYPIPVYINLAHFKNNYAATAEGLFQLVKKSIEQGCPRYFRDEENNFTSASQMDTIDILVEENRGGLFYIIDSMDEMSANQYLQRTKAIADFMDDPRRRSCLFLLTCRYFDYIKLADYTNNLKIQRIDLLPWTRELVNIYISTQIKDEHLRKSVLNSIYSFSAIKNNVSSYYHPLLVALICRIRMANTNLSLSDLWEIFVSDKIKSHLSGSILLEDDIKNKLGDIAYTEVWSTPKKIIPNEILEIAARAGLIRYTADGITFEIRPLMHHFAARELLRRVRENHSLPAEVRLEDINTREVFKCVSDQAVGQDGWIEVVTQSLISEPAFIRAHGDRLDFIAYSFTNSQIISNESLQTISSRLIEFLISNGDDVEKERCLLAIERKPSLLSSTEHNVSVFFSWIVEYGSQSALRWLIRLLFSNQKLRTQFRKLWIKAILKSFNQGKFGSIIQDVILARISKKAGYEVRKLINFCLHTLRLSILFIIHYCTYVATWLVAAWLASYIIRLVPDGPQLDMSDLLKRRLNFLDYTFQLGTLYMMLLSFYLPRYYINKQAQEQIKFQLWGLRYITLIGIAFCIRFVLFLWSFLLENLLFLRVVLFYALLFYMFYIIILFTIRIIKNPNEWRKILRLSIKGRGDSKIPFPQPSIHPGGSPGHAIVPSDLINVALLHDQVIKSNTDSVSSFKRFISILSGGTILSISGIALVFWGIGAALGVILLGIIIVLLFVLIVDPVIQSSRIKRRIKKCVRMGLTNNLKQAFLEVLREINDETLPYWIRINYVETLKEVRFNQSLYETLNTFYQTLQQSPIKTKLTNIVLQALHEKNKASR